LTDPIIAVTFRTDGTIHFLTSDLKFAKEYCAKWNKIKDDEKYDWESYGLQDDPERQQEMLP